MNNPDYPKLLLNRRNFIKFGMSSLAFSSSFLLSDNQAVAQTTPLLEKVSFSLAQEERLSELGYNASELSAFFVELKDVYLRSDLSKLQVLSAKPMNLRPGRRFIPLSTKKQFEECRRFLFSEDISDAILNEDGADLIINADGIALLDGSVWISHICDASDCNQLKFALRTINLPNAR